MSWDRLQGNDRIRYCDQCNLNVYNLADMSPGEVDEIVRKSEGRLCGRLYVRDDQTATIRDCPKSVFRKRLQAALALSALVLLAGIAWGLGTSDPIPRSRYPGWVRTVLEWIHPSSAPVVGRLCPKNPPTPPVPPPGTTPD